MPCKMYIVTEYDGYWSVNCIDHSFTIIAEHIPTESQAFSIARREARGHRPAQVVVLFPDGSAKVTEPIV